MSKTRDLEAAKFAFQQTIPVLMGYLFLGTAYGLMLNNAGYSVWWAFATSTLIYAGSMQFVLVTLLTGGASLVYAAMMTLFINGRHIFYGLSFVDKFKKSGRAYPYLVFSLTDETYSVLCGCKIPQGLPENKVILLISLLNQCYWIAGSVMGALLGELKAFDITGIDFSMTALFIVIFINQWKESKSHLPAWTGALSAGFFLLLLGPEHFLLPSLAGSVAVLLILKRRLEEEG